LFPLLTVRETFRYAAYFRIANKTVAEKDKIVGMTSYDVDYYDDDDVDYDDDDDGDDDDDDRG